jgi:hypothetical protein
MIYNSFISKGGKRYIRFVPIIAAFSFSIKANATDLFPLAGTRETGLANSTVAMSTIWSEFHNPAGIAGVSEFGFGLNYENRFLLREISTTSFAGVLPVKSGSFGISGSLFGTSIYNEQKYAFAYARNFAGKIDVGIQCDYLSVNLPEDYETRRTLAGEIGIIAHPFENLHIGCHLYNPTGAKYNKSYGSLPLIFRTGAAWIEDKYLISAQVQMSNQEKTTFSVGSEICLIKSMAVRVGISSQQYMSYTLGLGYKQDFWQADFAVAHHPVLGFSSFVSVEIRLKRKSP